MKTVSLLLSALLCCALTVAELNAAELLPSVATYKTRHGLMSATGTRTLEQQAGGRWQLTSLAQVMTLELVEQSQFTLQGGQIQPQRYDYINPFSKKRSRTLQFDWPQQRVTETRGNHQFVLEPKTLDRLSIQVQAQLDLCRAPKQFNRATYAIADRKNIKRYVMEKVGSGEIDTAVGKLQAIELKRYREGQPENATRIWVAPQWNCLLLKLEERDGSDPVELTLVKASVDGVEVKGR